MKFVKGISLFCIYPLFNMGEKEAEQIPSQNDDIVETIREEGVLNPDTEYVLQEMDIKSGTVVEYSYKLPVKYLGMNRDSFVGAMDAYEQSPPLKEVERGFVGLEVVTFSPQKVVIQMNYAFVEPTENFYIGVEQNYVVVYLEDKETVTGEVNGREAAVKVIAAALDNYIEKFCK